MTEIEKKTVEKARMALAELIQLTNGQAVELEGARETIRGLRQEIAYQKGLLQHFQRGEGLA